jgi:hypothetical protein
MDKLNLAEQNLLRISLESTVLNFYAMENDPNNQTEKALFIECAQKTITHLQTAINTLKS